MYTIQIRAPGSPVIIICTHRDKVTKQDAEELENKAWRKYAPKTGYYPDVRENSSTKIVAVFSFTNLHFLVLYVQVIDIMSVNCKGAKVRELRELRERIYKVTCHLQLIMERDGTTACKFT